MTFDTAVAGASGTAGSFSWSHTCTTNNNRGIFVFLRGGNGEGDRVSGITYNSTPMSKFSMTVSNGGGSNQTFSGYYLANPSTGSNTIAISMSSSGFIQAVSVSYYDILQSGIPDAINTNNAPASTGVTVSTTTVLDQCWTLLFVGGDAISGSGGITERVSNGSVKLFDSNSGKTPAGSVSMTATGNTADWAGIIVSLAPFVGSSSVSPSASASESKSQSPSASVSQSSSESKSESKSSSASNSSSSSQSISPSASFSQSASQSLSPSGSSSSSPSASVSPSTSESRSSSPSSSPSFGYSNYTREENAVLPSNDNDLSTTYTEQEEIDVSESDNIRVGQTGTLTYMIHQFKVFAGSNNSCQITWEGQSTLAPSLSPVYLQVYDYTNLVWTTVRSKTSGSEDTDFKLRKEIIDLTNYKDSGNVIASRVYQLAI